MSYILEALRRAESERERKRGGVPGLHANPVPMPSSDDRAEGTRPWTWVAGGLTVGVLLMILWRWWSVEPLVDEAALARAPVEGNVSQGNASPPVTTPAAPAAAQPAPSPPPAPAEPAPPAAATPAPAPKAGSAASEEPARSRKPATPPRSSATAVASPRNPQAAPAPAPPQAPTAKATGVPAPVTQPTPQGTQAPMGRNAAPAPAPERLRTLAELPDDLRRSVPQLTFGGSVYSDTPAQRMVIFNGQVMREGDAINEELQIEQIRPRSAVMRVRGQRFEMPF